jgi:hypothetical protein
MKRTSLKALGAATTVLVLGLSLVSPYARAASAAADWWTPMGFSAADVGEAALPWTVHPSPDDEISSGQPTLSLAFSAGKRRQFPAGVHLTIQDEAGKVVFDAPVDRPIILVELPAGDYRVIAEAHHTVLTRSVHIKADAPNGLEFHWATV